MIQYINFNNSENNFSKNINNLVESVYLEFWYTNGEKIGKVELDPENKICFAQNGKIYSWIEAENTKINGFYPNPSLKVITLCDKEIK